MFTTYTAVTPEIGAYLRELFSNEDEFLRSLNAEAIAEGIPPISIASEQTGFLAMMLAAVKANVVVEIGSLAGYSAIAMARTLPKGSHLYTCELNPKNADFIRRKVAQAGLEQCITIVEGPALQSLPALLQQIREQVTEFVDVVFIDADKINYANYLEIVLPFVKTGGLIIADNALAFGYIASEPPAEEYHNVLALRAFNRTMSTHPRLISSIVPLGDGMVVGVVR